MGRIPASGQFFPSLGWGTSLPRTTPTWRGFFPTKLHKVPETFAAKTPCRQVLGTRRATGRKSRLPSILDAKSRDILPANGIIPVSGCSSAKGNCWVPALQGAPSGPWVMEGFMTRGPGVSVSRCTPSACPNAT